MNENAPKRTGPAIRKLKRTVLIGLGGTGKKALLHAKKRFLETFGEEPPLVKYLLIDTTSANTDHLEAKTPQGTKPVRLRADEILQIEARGASLLPQVHDEIREWFPPKADLKANILSGAGQIRALGRLALFANATTVYENLRDLLALARDFRDERPRPDLANVYEPFSPHLTVALVGSLAGGTGSGIFLDVAFVLRHLMKDEDQLFGYFLLPDIYVNRPGTQNVEANAYAALKELDHFMSLQGTHRYRFGGKDIEIRKKPFDMVFLVNRQNRAGKTFNEVDDLMELLGLGLYLLGGPLGKEQADTFDNIVHQLNEQKGKYYGKTAHYASFGAAELRFEPGRLVGTYLKRAREDYVKNLLDLDYDWRASNALAKLKELEAFDPGVEPGTPPVSSSLAEDRALLPGVLNDAKRLLGEAKEGVLRAVPLSEVASLLKEEVAQAIRMRQTGLVGVTRALEDLLQQARELQKKLVEEAQELERRLDQQRDGLRREVNDRPGLPMLMNRSSQREVLTRKTVSSLFENAITTGTQIGRAEAAGNWVAAIEGLLRDINSLKQRLHDLLARQEAEPQMGSRDAQPFTLTLPPSYLDQEDRVLGATDRAVAWDLEALLKDPEQAIREALPKEPTFTLAEWLGWALEQKERDPDLWEAVERTFRELDAISAPAWDYEDAWVSNPGLGYREQVHILGLKDATDRSDPLVDSEEVINLFASNLHDRMRLQRVSTGDGKRVLFYKIEASIPAFVLRGIHIYREKYDTLSQDRSFHIHREWENGMGDLFPEPSEQEVAHVWTKARALGLLTKEEDGYGFLDRRMGTPRRHILGNLAASAFEVLRKDFFSFKELESQVKKAEAERRRNKAKLEELKAGLPEVIAKRKGLLEDPAFNEEDKNVFRRELGVLEAWLKEVQTLRPDAGEDHFPTL
jgi:hypothetical protein